MSRSGYSDDIEDPRERAMWRGQVASSMRGKRGQRLLRDLGEAMDAMPVKVLIAENLVAEGSYCALGVVGRMRGIDLGTLDPEDVDSVSEAFDIATPLAREIVFINDERGYHDTPTKRWLRMRAWVAEHVTPSNAGGEPQSASIAR